MVPANPPHQTCDHTAMNGGGCGGFSTWVRSLPPREGSRVPPRQLLAVMVHDSVGRKQALVTAFSAVKEMGAHMCPSTHAAAQQCWMVLVSLKLQQEGVGSAA
jgi:hypothetical protein